MKLIPILQDAEDNKSLLEIDVCKDMVMRNIEYYKTVGFEFPWIGFVAMEGEEYVGTCGFKGAPKEEKVEIAYVTFEEQRNKGYGTVMCAELVAMSLSQDEDVLISARTLPENNQSTRILEKNGFAKLKMIIDHDGKEVWEWLFQAI